MFGEGGSDPGGATHYQHNGCGRLRHIQQPSKEYKPQSGSISGMSESNFIKNSDCLDLSAVSSSSRSVVRSKKEAASKKFKGQQEQTTSSVDPSHIEGFPTIEQQPHTVIPQSPKSQKAHTADSEATGSSPYVLGSPRSVQPPNTNKPEHKETGSQPLIDGPTERFQNLGPFSLSISEISSRSSPHHPAVAHEFVIGNTTILPRGQRVYKLVEMEELDRQQTSTSNPELNAQSRVKNTLLVNSKSKTRRKTIRFDDVTHPEGIPQPTKAISSNNHKDPTSKPASRAPWSANYKQRLKNKLSANKNQLSATEIADLALAPGLAPAVGARKRSQSAPKVREPKNEHRLAQQIPTRSDSVTRVVPEGRQESSQQNPRKPTTKKPSFLQRCRTFIRGIKGSKASTFVSIKRENTPPATSTKTKKSVKLAVKFSIEKDQKVSPKRLASPPPPPRPISASTSASSDDTIPINPRFARCHSPRPQFVRERSRSENSDTSRSTRRNTRKKQYRPGTPAFPVPIASGVDLDGDAHSADDEYHTDSSTPVASTITSADEFEINRRRFLRDMEKGIFNHPRASISTVGSSESTDSIWDASWNIGNNQEYDTPPSSRPVTMENIPDIAPTTEIRRASVSVKNDISPRKRISSPLLEEWTRGNCIDADCGEVYGTVERWRADHLRMQQQLEERQGKEDGDDGGEFESANALWVPERWMKETEAKGKSKA